ncbi:MAG TPA: ABC transporter ATP-binding protein [Acidimicrobiales bacterium]|nr:ABC transporter ATP-binding protein [Acidimicrobiales bacterium]
MTTATTPRRRPLVAKGETPTTAMLELRDIHHSYELGAGTLPILHGVDLRVDRGEVVAIVGRSGSGKSTLLHLAGGLNAPDRGDVLLDGTSLSSMGARGRAIARRQRIGFVFQAFHLLPGLDVIENVAMPLLLNGESRQRAKERARPLLIAVGLDRRADHLPSELSGGELQRAAIARALVADPALVLADEPTGNLDSATAEDIIHLLVSRVRDAGVAMLLVTHDPSIAARADRVLTMADGQLA